MAANAIKFEQLIQNKLFNDDNRTQFTGLASIRNDKQDITRCLLIALCEKVKCKLNDENIFNKVHELQEDLLNEIIGQSKRANTINDCIDFLVEIKL